MERSTELLSNIDIGGTARSPSLARRGESADRGLNEHLGGTKA